MGGHCFPARMVIQLELRWVRLTNARRKFRERRRNQPMEQVLRPVSNHVVRLHGAVLRRLVQGQAQN